MGNNVTDMGKIVTLMGETVTDMGEGKRSMQKPVRQELKKHAATIHCSNTLSLLQRKITNALLYHAYPELMQKEEHEITVKQLCRLIGYQGHNHAAIREAFKGLLATIIEWNLISDVSGEENWTASSIIASVSLEGPLCYYAYSPRMKQLLHSPSMFGKIDLVIQSRFRSSYGLALYENCIRYRGLPKTKWIEIDLFRKLMGVPPGKYIIFRDLKRRVLDKAVDEVNTYSDLTITLELAREGRKVSGVRFLLKERPKKPRLGIKKGSSSEPNLKIKLHQNFHLSETQIVKLLKQYSLAYIMQKISLIESSRPYQEGKIKNLSAYLLSAIKNDYQLPQASDAQAGAQAEMALPVVLSAPSDLELKRAVEAIRMSYQRYRQHAIHEAIDALTANEKATFMQKFWQSIEKTLQVVFKLQRHRYKPENILDSPQIQAQLRQFALRELDSITLTSLEEFVQLKEDSLKLAWQRLKSFDPDHPLLRFQEEI